MLTQTTIEINGVKYPGDAAHTLLSNELSSAKAENVKLKEELAACKVDAEFRLTDYINAADISAADMPNIVVEKLQRAIDAARKEQP